MVLRVELSEESCLSQNRWSHSVMRLNAVSVYLSNEALMQDPDTVRHVFGLADILACWQLQAYAGVFQRQLETAQRLLIWLGGTECGWLRYALQDTEVTSE